MIDDIKNFLLDKDYYIDMFDNKLHVFNYSKLLLLSDKLIKIKISTFELEILGIDLKILKMNDTELLIDGIINNVRFTR